MTDIDLTTGPTTTNPAPSGDATALPYRKLRAPADSFGVLIDPPMSEAELLLKSNLAASANDFWTQLRRQARSQLIADARRYTSSYRDVSGLDRAPTADGQQPIIMAGHQPTLFHPGVWFKNHTLQKLASDCGAVPINLVIDNDVAGGRAIRVPRLDTLDFAETEPNPSKLTKGSWETVAYDRGGSAVPFEQATIQDTELFDHFDSGVRRAIAPLVANPCVTDLWRHAREAIRRCGIAGCALAQARHALEADMGWQTLEIPLGVAVRDRPFSRFVMEIIDEIERFQTVYNDSADHYRAWHGIRSSAHPVPNLSTRDGWFETPLWVYGNSAPHRRGVWVRREGDQWHFSDSPSGNSPDTGSVSVFVSARDRDLAASQLADAASPEFKLRPRALMTTMFARLVLSDLFLHGIGGGKYDQLADRIIVQFFGITPPRLQVVSGTIRLPGQAVDPDREDRRQALTRKLREFSFQGEKWLDSDSAENHLLIERKASLLAAIPTSGGRRDWHHEVAHVNTQMADRLSSQRRSVRSELARLNESVATERILASREHSFCLFPLDFLQESFAEMA